MINGTFDWVYEEEFHNKDGMGNLWYHLLNQKGYIVMSVDNRGAYLVSGNNWFFGSELKTRPDTTQYQSRNKMP